MGGDVQDRLENNGNEKEHHATENDQINKGRQINEAAYSIAQRASIDRFDPILRVGDATARGNVRFVQAGSPAFSSSGR